MKKETKLWKTKEGKKIRICDMTDTHLLNTVKILEQYATHMEGEYIRAGYEFLGGLHGEMAIETVENGLAQLEEDGIVPNEICPLYNNLENEVNRRGLIPKQVKRRKVC